MFLGWLYDRTGDFRHVLYTASAVSAIAACFIILWFCLATKGPLSPEIIEELISEDHSTLTSCDSHTTIVYLEDYVDPKLKLQYISAV